MPSYSDCLNFGVRPELSFGWLGGDGAGSSECHVVSICDPPDSIAQSELRKLHCCVGFGVKWIVINCSILGEQENAFQK